MFKCSEKGTLFFLFEIHFYQLPSLFVGFFLSFSSLYIVFGTEGLSAFHHTQKRKKENPFVTRTQVREEERALRDCPSIQQHIQCSSTKVETNKRALTRYSFINKLIFSPDSHCWFSSDLCRAKMAY